MKSNYAESHFLRLQDYVAEGSRGELTAAESDYMDLLWAAVGMVRKYGREAALEWLTEERGFSYSEGGLPIAKDGEYPDLYAAFEGIDMVSDADALPGEETLLSELNSESELNFNAGGNTKVQAIVEHAFNGDESFEDIMAEWNQAWSDAQESLGVEVNE
jgi:hypothetical protein